MANYDLIIVGSGLAGLTAGLFAARHGLSTLVMESNICGGHLINIEKIDDFPGFPEGVAGFDLCPTVQRQASDQGAEFQRAEVEGLEAQDRFWQVFTSEENHLAKSVIVATGSTLKELGVPGEAELRGRGVSHCASCDGPLYDGRVVGVVGGGDSALQEALALASHAERVMIFHREAQFSAQHAYEQKLLSNSKITPRYQTVVNEILGRDVVVGARIRDLATRAVAEVELAAIFVYVGLQPNTALLKNTLNLTDSGHVPTDGWMRTERPGLFAVGDIREDSPGQAITSAGEGAVAAIAASRYIKKTFPN